MNDNTISPTALQSYLSDTRPICFGRFLIDVPKEADIVFGRQEADGDLEYVANGEKRLNELIISQLAQLEADRYLIGSRHEDVPRYGDVIHGPIPGQRIVYGSADYAFHSLTSYVPMTPHLFVHKLDSSIDNDKDIESMNKVASSIRLRALDEIPREPGFCFEGGLVTADAEYENISIGIRLHRYPDVHLSLATIAHTKFLPAATMIEERIRSAEENASPMQLLWHKRIKYLRRGNKTLGFWKGEEVAARLPPQERQGESHQFKFISLGEIKNRFHPEIDIELVSGVKGNARGSVKPSLSDEEMLLLWDTLISSIRVRPTGTVEVKPARKAALGQLQATGHICAQSGWWECDEPGVIPEARKKFVREGEPMPKTTVKVERTAWEKLTGSPELGHSGTVWKLIAYDDPDIGPSGG